MKLVHHFDDFLRDVVNLNDTRIAQLEASCDAIEKFIRDSDWEPSVRRFGTQGSWAHKTIIKPVANKEFDADLIVFVDPVDGWSAREYLNTLRAEFAESGVYKEKVRRYSHCVTVEYAGERKIDITPVIVGRDGADVFEVCNHLTDEFELTDPDAYTDWLLARNGWTGLNGLRKATRLIKYLRDIKLTFSCKSVLLTTLLGSRISAADDINEKDFEDVPTALKTIIGRLDAWLQDRPFRPEVTNPVLATEIFSGSWDDTKYANFREKIHDYRVWIDDAYSDHGRESSVKKWRRVFGDDFAPDAVQKADAGRVGSLSESAPQVLASPFDLVDLFHMRGRAVLPAEYADLAHREQSRWLHATAGWLDVEVTAEVFGYRNQVSQGIYREDRCLPKTKWLRFSAWTRGGGSLPRDHSVHWRITNNGEEARVARCLRGGFDPSSEGHSRWEQLAYRGIHVVEAFVTRNADHRLVGQSRPLYVGIK